MPLALETLPALETSRPYVDELPKEAIRRTIRDLLESPEPLADVETVFDRAASPLASAAAGS